MSTLEMLLIKKHRLTQLYKSFDSTEPMNTEEGKSYMLGLTQLVMTVMQIKVEQEKRSLWKAPSVKQI